MQVQYTVLHVSVPILDIGFSHFFFLSTELIHLAIHSLSVCITQSDNVLKQS